MPVCPNCNLRQERRKNGACPHCGARVEMHGGRWFRTSLGSPAVAVLKRFEGLVSIRLGEGRDRPVPYSIPPKSPRYRRELVTAERLLEGAEWDYDLVIAAMELLFTDKRLDWKFRDSLAQVERDFLTALALAKANRAAELETHRREQRAFLRAMSQEDIFS